MSYFPNHREFYVFAIHAIYAVLLASSFNIANDFLVPLSKITSGEDFIHVFGILFVYTVLISGWIGYTKSVSVRPHIEGYLGNLRFIMDLFIVFVTFYIVNLTSSLEIFKNNFYETFMYLLPILFSLYLVWDIIKLFEYRKIFTGQKQLDETLINFNRLSITAYFLAVVLIQDAIFIYIFMSKNESHVLALYFLFIISSFIIILFYRKFKWNTPSLPKSPEI